MSKNYWLHRISHHAEASYPLLERNLLSIGFSGFSTEGFLKRCVNNWDTFEKTFEEEWGTKPRSRYSLWRFISAMKKGDLVIVPSWGTFSIYEIEENNCFSVEQIDLTDFKDWNNNPIILGDNGCLIFDIEKKPVLDLGFFRKVKPIILSASRNDFADSALTSRMKIRTTNANISDLKGSVEKAIDSYKRNKPINLHALILEKNLENTMSLIKSVLNPDKLEKLVHWYLRKVGASDIYIPSKNEAGKEGDADVVATFEAIKTIIYVQVKFHNGETSDWALEQIENYKTHKEKTDDGYSKIAWIVSTADNFSQECNKQAKINGVQLIEGKEFTKMLLEAGISNLSEVL